MRRICLAVTVLVAAAAPVRAQLRFAETRIDLGEVRAGMPTTCRFRFDNVGTTPIDLVDLERSCGCLQPVWHEKGLEPGQAGSIEMSFRTLGQSEGLRTWHATLIHRVGAEVRRQPLLVTATIRNEITIEPPQVAVTVKTSLVQSIVLVDHRTRTLRVTEATSRAAGVRIKTIAASAEKTVLEVHIDGSALVPGRHDEVLTIRTDDPVYPVLEVPLTLVREEKTAVTWSPEAPEIVLAPEQKQASALLQIRSEKPLVIRSIAASEPGISCTWATGDNGTTVRIRVDRETFRGRTLLPCLHVETDGPPIDVPVEIRLE